MEHNEEYKEIINVHYDSFGTYSKSLADFLNYAVAPSHVQSCMKVQAHIAEQLRREANSEEQVIRLLEKELEVAREIERLRAEEKHPAIVEMTGCVKILSLCFGAALIGISCAIIRDVPSAP